MFFNNTRFKLFEMSSENFILFKGISYPNIVLYKDNNKIYFNYDRSLSNFNKFFKENDLI